MVTNPELILSFGAIILIAVSCLYLMIRPSGIIREWSLLIALIVTAAIELIDLAILQNPEKLLVLKPTVFIFETLLPLCWAVYATGLSGRSLLKRSLNNGLFWAGGLILLSLAVIPQEKEIVFNPNFSNEHILFLGQTGFFFYLFLTIYLVIALVLLERSFTSLAHQDRWCLKFEALGTGSIITMQLIYFSQGFLYKTIDMSLVPARTTAIVIGLLLFLYARLRRGKPTQLALSQEAAFRSVVLLCVCGYLIFMGLAGEGLRYLGPSSNRALLFTIALVAGVALSSIFLSESLRRKTKVFLHKNFYRQKYDYRILWMEMSARLGTAKDIESRYQAILETYCQTFAISYGAIYLNRGDQEGLPLVSIHGDTEVPERIDHNGSLAHFLKSTKWVFNLRENSEMIATAEAELLKKHSIQFVVPIFFDEELGGVVVLCRQININEPIIYEDYDLMKIFGRQIATILFNDRLSRQLIDQREMVAVGKVSTFVMHDLKNLVSILSLVVENAKELIHNQKFQKDMLETLANTVSHMNSLIGKLKHVGGYSPLTCGTYDLKQLAEETVDNIGNDRVTISGDNVSVKVDRHEISKVITNLILNAIEASNAESEIQIEINHGPEPFLVCRDQGSGMSEDFMTTNLFRPFETTKRSGLGVGLYHCRQIVDAHGGRIEVTSDVGIGSEFKVYLPAAQKDGGI